ncbi:hypothetical protein [Nocardia sp. NPDC052112]|uniref:hypothetical protein n=1 Tax=Nocardia sp. NPDC052112 TaxID=3155646 RepID=UPI00343FF70F
MTTVVDRELWIVGHADCAGHGEVRFGSIDEARFVPVTHSGHGPQCRQYLAAAAYSGGVNAQDDWDD